MLATKPASDENGCDGRSKNPKFALLRQMFDAAIASAQPSVSLPKYLPRASEGPAWWWSGAGKASAAMARAMEEALGRAR